VKKEYFKDLLVHDMFVLVNPDQPSGLMIMVAEKEPRYVAGLNKKGELRLDTSIVPQIAPGQRIQLVDRRWAPGTSYR